MIALLCSHASEEEATAHRSDLARTLLCPDMFADFRLSECQTKAGSSNPSSLTLELHCQQCCFRLSGCQTKAGSSNPSSLTSELHCQRCCARCICNSEVNMLPNEGKANSTVSMISKCRRQVFQASIACAGALECSKNEATNKCFGVKKLLGHHACGVTAEGQVRLQAECV